MRADLNSWFERRMGAYLLRQERVMLREVLPTVFGYFLVQAGAWGPAGELLESSAIRARFMLDQQYAAGIQICALPGDLPFSSDSVDALLLPHTLEHSKDPARILREAERVLMGEGHLIVLGFHPWGLWAMQQRFNVATPWAGDYVGAGRLREWLTVLGFEILSIRHYLFRPPFQNRLLLRSTFLDRLHWRMTASAYMLVARKRVFALTPLRLKRVRPRPAFAGVVNPTAR
ncbi:MAG TPA: methyltransferase domain-containing protein [Gammaproteobacteria bacterium]|nr:methyltransferase domain-containing protein [Gammaproteobacteria bacterium]